MANPSSLSFERPYVHSNINNYLSFVKKNSLPSGKKKAVQEIREITSQLSNISSQLKSKADRFLGKDADSITQADLRNIFYANGKIGEFQRAAINFLYNKEYVDTILPYTKIKKGELQSALRSAGLNINKKLADKILKQLGGNDDSIIDYNKILTVIYNIIEQEISKVKGVQFNRTKKTQINIISSLNGIFNKKQIDQIVSNFRSPYSNQRNLAKAISGELGISYKNLLQNQALDTETFCKTFETYMRNNFPNLTQQENELLKDFVKECITSFKQTLSKMNYNTSNILGDIQEIIVPEIIIKGGVLEIINTGSLPEISKDGKDSVKKITGTLESGIKKSVYKQSDKQSYTDLIFERNGVKVRVQSKNSLSSAAPVFLNENEDRSSFINILGAPITPQALLEKLESSGNFAAIDPAMLGYTLANDYWFSHHNSMFRGDKNTGPINRKENSIKQLTDLILNALGVVIPDSIDVDETALNDSNIFWLITGAFVPTYKIVDGIRHYFDENIDAIASFTLQISSKGSVPRADIFYKQKLDVMHELKGNGSNKSNYEDEKFLKVGQGVGQSIMDNYTIDAVKLKIISMKNLLQTYQISDFI